MLHLLRKDLNIKIMYTESASLVMEVKTLEDTDPLLTQAQGMLAAFT
tara:strand:+ start:1776 stop:1916 length:141 start_codon:yes stop_codon:yes gene_type:complete